MYLLRRRLAFGKRHLLEGALHLDQVEGLAADLDGGLEDGFHFAELVLVAGDEVDHGGWWGWGLGCHFGSMGVWFVRREWGERERASRKEGVSWFMRASFWFVPV